jgi:hypothetical protein
MLAVLTAVPAHGQVGGTPAPPVTLWQFLGIPQGVKKLQGATRNRRGNRPNREPKPPMRAIADPRNLESPDASIKKAAEVKTLEDLKMQKIKAVKYLASIGCGCYDADGGVTAALVASMQDCTEDVRYETIKAISEATEEGACAKCGEGCCCNKEILTTLAKIAYERRDDGCYLEASERVREAAREALETCCPNDSPPVVIEEAPAPAQQDRETGSEEIEEDSREAAPLPPGSLPPPPPTPLPSVQADPASGMSPQVTAENGVLLTVPQGYQDGAAYHFGVVVHVSAERGLAHVHFTEPGLMLEKGSAIGVFAQMGQTRELLAKLDVIESFPGSATVTGSHEALARISRGDIALRPSVAADIQPKGSVHTEWVSSHEEPSSPAVEQVEFTAPSAPPQIQVAAPTAAPPKPMRRPPSQSAALQKASTARRGVYTGFVR